MRRGGGGGRRGGAGGGRSSYSRDFEDHGLALLYWGVSEGHVRGGYQQFMCGCTQLLSPSQQSQLHSYYQHMCTLVW